MAHIGGRVKGITGNGEGDTLIFEHGFYEHVDGHRGVHAGGAAEFIKLVFVIAVQAYT